MAKLASFPGLRPSFCRLQYAGFFTRCEKSCGVEPWNEAMGKRLQLISALIVVF